MIYVKINETSKFPATDWISLISSGFLIVILGYLDNHSKLFSRAVNFGKDFHLENVAGNILLPAPANNHPCFLHGNPAAVSCCWHLSNRYPSLEISSP